MGAETETETETDLLFEDNSIYYIHKKERERERKETWAPWFQVLRRALKMPAGEKSESPKACSSENWIFES